MKLYWQILFAPEGVGGAGDPASISAPQPGQQPGGQPHSYYKPEGLPDDMFGGSDKATIDKLWGGLQAANTRIEGFRTDMASRGQVPEKLDAYKFELSEKAKPAIQIGDDDKLMKTIPQLAQKHKLTDKQYAGFLGDFFDTVVDMGLIEKPIDPKTVYKALGEGKGKTDEEMIQAGGQRLKNAQAFINSFTPERDGFDQAMKDELALLTTSAAGVKVIEAIAKTGIQKTVSPGGGAAPGAVTKEGLQARQADPRNDRNNRDKYDPDFAAETVRQYKQMFGS